MKWRYVIWAFNCFRFKFMLFPSFFFLVKTLDRWAIICLLLSQMTCFLKSSSTFASSVSSSSFFNVLNRYCLFLGNSLKSNLSLFATISKIYLSDDNFFHYLANSLEFLHVNFIVNSYLFTRFSISVSSDDRVSFAGFDSSSCFSVLFLAVSGSTRFVNCQFCEFLENLCKYFEFLTNYSLKLVVYP